jgi:hypothetical protein
MGTPCITIKDAVWQQSGPLRHSAEFLSLLYEHFDVHNNPSAAVLLKYHDGGGDHNDTHPWQQICSIIEWLHTKMDLLTSERTVPGQSYIDPAERVFSPLNMALQCTALERERTSPEVEQLTKHASSMNAIRAIAQNNGSVPVAASLLESTRKVRKQVADLFKKVVFGGEQIDIGKVASNEDMQRLFDTIHTIDPNITQADVAPMHKMYKKFPKLEEFCKSHCR